MGERTKTILLILFIAGVIGAFNSIVRLSQTNNETPLQLITQALGLTKKPAPEQGRKLNYVTGQHQNTSVTGSNTPQNAEAESKSTQPRETPQITATPTPRPTTKPAGIQTAPNLPPLPPISSVQGAKTAKLPPLPPINKKGKALGVKTENSFEDNLKKVLNYFGF